MPDQSTRESISALGHEADTARAAANHEAAIVAYTQALALLASGAPDCKLEGAEITFSLNDYLWHGRDIKDTALDVTMGLGADIAGKLFLIHPASSRARSRAYCAKATMRSG